MQGGGSLSRSRQIKDAKKTGPGDVAEEQNMVNADKHFVAKIPKGRPIGRVTG